MNPQPDALADPDRLARIRDLRSLRNPSAELLNELTALASAVLHVPTCIVSLMDEDREWIASSAGLVEPWATRGELPLDHSYCQHLVTTGELLLIEDARKHERVRDSPAIETLQAIAYAGVPLRSPDGHVLGGFCVVDREPRSWMDREVQTLQRFAAIAVAELGHRLRIRAAERRREAEQRKFSAELAALSRFRTLVEHSLAGIYVLQDGRFLYTNSRMREIFGYGPGKPMSHLRVSDLVAEEDRERVLENVRRRLAGESLRVSYTFRGLRADGGIVDVEVYGSRIEVDGGYAIIGTLLDITKRKRAEKALRESEERLRLVERATEDVVWEWEVRTGEVRWNEAGAKVFRYLPGEVGTTIEWHQEHIHPDDRERVARRLQRTLGGVGEFWSEEYRFLRGDGQYATVVDRGIVVRNGRGEPVRVIGSMMDVTERKREEEAQRFLAQASALMDSSLDREAILPRLARLCIPLLGDYSLVDLVDEQGHLHRVATAHVDPRKEELLARESILGTSEVPERSLVARALRTGEPAFVPECGDPEGRDPDDDRDALGRIGVCSLIVAPLLIGERRIGAITIGTSDSGRVYTPVDLMHVQDLAHRLAFSIDHARLYQEATDAVRARDEVLGVVTHDLRNPLSAIQMSAALLREGGQERRAENQKWVDIILNTADQMNHLIGDLLDLSSIDAGRFSVDAAEQKVSAITTGAIELLEPLANEKEIRMAARVGEGVTTVWADTGQILRVLSNLVGNAIKFTPTGGAVLLTVERTESEVLFSVSDTGPGIPAEHQPHVFDRYWQATAGDRRGAGLGLAIAKGIVESHGGRIWADGGEGKGATFHFTLPREAPRDAPRAGRPLSAVASAAPPPAPSRPTAPADPGLPGDRLEARSTA